MNIVPVLYEEELQQLFLYAISNEYPRFDTLLRHLFPEHYRDIITRGTVEGMLSYIEQLCVPVSCYKT